MSFARIRHPEWEARTTGTLAYARDIRPEGLLVGKVLRSPYPAAEIAGIDATAAREAPGVHAVLTAMDLPERSYKDYGRMDRVAMARDRAIYAGQEVAAVAAETAAEAEAALALIRIDWQPLPHAATVEAALARGAPSVHPDRAPDNVVTRAERCFGDPAARTGRRFAARYDCGAQHHACMEPHSALAYWDAEAGVMNFWTPTQAPRGIAAEMAHMLGLDPGQIRLHRVGVGGDFGARVKAGDIEVIAAHLSRATDRHVAIRLDRAEEFAFAKRQHQTWIELASYVDETGRVRFREGEVTVDNGAFIQGGSNQMNYASILLAAHYSLEGAEIRGRSVYTNTRPGGASRGAGGPQAIFAVESQMDEIAQALGIDPVELRPAQPRARGDDDRHRLGGRDHRRRRLSRRGKAQARLGPQDGAGRIGARCRDRARHPCLWRCRRPAHRPGRHSAGDRAERRGWCSPRAVRTRVPGSMP